MVVALFLSRVHLLRGPVGSCLPCAKFEEGRNSHNVARECVRSHNIETGRVRNKSRSFFTKRNNGLFCVTIWSITLDCSWSVPTGGVNGIGPNSETYIVGSSVLPSVRVVRIVRVNQKQQKKFTSWSADHLNIPTVKAETTTNSKQLFLNECGASKW